MLKFAVPRLFLISVLFFATIGCDQVTKVVARDTLRFSLRTGIFNVADMSVVLGVGLLAIGSRKSK